MTELRELPEPPVPADCDLKDFAYTPIFRARLFGSAFHARANDSEWRAGVTLWLKAQDQVPAGSLPDDDIELCRLAELGRDMKTWRKLRAGALHGWYLCSDGRLYNKTVAEVVNEQWESKIEKRREREEWREKKRRQRRDVPDGSPETSIGTDGNVPGDVPREKALKRREGKGREGNTYSDPNGSGPAAPSLGTIHPIDGDWSTPLFRQGVAYLAAATGKPPDSKRSLVGRWLKSCGQDHKRVFDLLAEAQRRAVADPEAWVTKALDQRAADPKAALPFPGYVPMHPGAGG